MCETVRVGLDPCVSPSLQLICLSAIPLGWPELTVCPDALQPPVSPERRQMWKEGNENTTYSLCQGATAQKKTLCSVLNTNADVGIEKRTPPPPPPLDRVRKRTLQEQPELLKPPLESLMTTNQMHSHRLMKQLALMYTCVESAQHC